MLSRRDGQFLKPVLDINLKKIRQGHVFSRVGREAADAEVSRN